MSDVFLCFFNHELLNQGVEKFMAEKSGFEKFRVEISFNLIERIHFNPGLFNPRIFNHERFKNSWLKSPGLKSSWFKSLGLKILGLKSPGLKYHLSRRLKDISTPWLKNSWLKSPGL